MQEAPCPKHLPPIAASLPPSRRAVARDGYSHRRSSFPLDGPCYCGGPRTIERIKNGRQPAPIKQRVKEKLICESSCYHPTPVHETLLPKKGFNSRCRVTWPH